MTVLKTSLLAAAALGLAAGALAGTAAAQPGYDGYGVYGGYGHRDGYARRRPGADLVGPGVRELLPELRETGRGRAFVLDNFDWNHDGVVEVREARAADRAFLDRGREWNDHDRADGEDDFRPGPPPPPPPSRPDGWDRQGMRDYHFRQGTYGATFTLSDVLFRTGSAELLPEARERLRPLTEYLRSNPQARVRIDGYTDSVGSDASNLLLSRNRAASVGEALEDAGFRRDRLQLEGHGESSPVATNATDAGRRLNRRVEVTLVGERADRFR